MDEPFACEALSCAALADHDLAWCEKNRCPFAYVRRRVEDRAEIDRKDRLEGRIGIQPLTEKRRTAMDEKQLKAAAEEIQKFGSMFGNMIALGNEIESVLALEARASVAEKTLAKSEAKHEAIHTVVGFEENAAKAGERIVALTEKEQSLAAAKESTLQSLADAREQLAGVQAEVAAEQTKLSKIKGAIADIHGKVA